MNESTPASPASDPNFSASSGDNSSASPAARSRKSIGVWRRFWWVPLLAVLISLGACEVYLRAKTPVYSSSALLFRPLRLKLPEEWGLFSQTEPSPDSWLELLQSETLRDRTLERLKSIPVAQNFVIPLDKEGLPIPVTIRVISSAKSSVVTIEATSTDASYTQKYLDAVMFQFLAFHSDSRNMVSDQSLVSIADATLRYETLLYRKKEVEQAFQQTNNTAVLESQGPVAVEMLKKLNLQLSDLQLEDQAFARAPLNQVETVQHQALLAKIEHVGKAINEWNTKIAETSRLLSQAGALRRNVQDVQSILDKLNKLEQDVQMSGMLDQPGPQRLQSASLAKQNHDGENSLLAASAGGGLGLGLGMMGLLKLFGAIRRKVAGAHSDLAATEKVIDPIPVGGVHAAPGGPY